MGGHYHRAIDDVELVSLQDCRGIAAPQLAGDPELIAAVMAKCGTLADRELLVIWWRFGFETNEKTLAEIADSLRVTRERVRQIEATGLYKIRKAMAMQGDKYELPSGHNRY
ncbi:hypothetical protein CCP3SC15_5750001 [Gammaproteobacteria bacterium]